MPVHVHGPFQQALVLMFACLLPGRRVSASAPRRVANQRLRTRLAGLHTGRDARVDGSYPAEVQPLVNDLNALLDQREQAVRRAVAKAGDLAHGLKTPLAILANEAERAEAPVRYDFAAAISQQVDRMRRQVDYHLAHARAAASGVSAGAPRRRSANQPMDWCARWSGCMPQRGVGDRHRSAQRDRTPFAFTAKISTRCSEICSTMPANGRDPAWSSRVGKG